MAEFTLCWDCRKAKGFCSWSAILKPVEGWKALPTIRKPGTRDEMRSYYVMECPEFERDAYNGGAMWPEEYEARHQSIHGDHHPEK